MLHRKCEYRKKIMNFWGESLNGSPQLSWAQIGPRDQNYIRTFWAVTEQTQRKKSSLVRPGSFSKTPLHPKLSLEFGVLYNPRFQT